MFLNIKSQLPSGTKLVGNWMGWFKGADGTHHRANVCQSDDPRTVRNQALAMHSVGFDGVVDDWYGGGAADKADPTDKATVLLAKETANLGMEISMMLDKGAFSGAPVGQQRQQVFNAALQYIRAHYFTLPNYSRLNGKPLIWEFGWQEHGIDIASVAKTNPDILILSQSRMAGGGGTYGWVNGFPPSTPKAYMDWYLSHTQDPIMVPCIFDKFNDANPKDPTKSIWGGPVRTLAPGLAQMCIDGINKAAAAGKKFPMVQYASWNDVDEQTELESQVLALMGMKLF